MKVINKYNKTTDKKLKNNFFKKMYDNLLDILNKNLSLDNKTISKKLSNYILN